MKTLTYKVKGYTAAYNPETEEVEQQVSFATVTSACPTPEIFDANYLIAEQVAVGEILVEGEFDLVPDSMWDELDAAYQSGYSEGYVEGVNGAYDQ